MRRGHRRGLSGVKLRQDLPANLFENLGRASRGVLEIEDDVMDSNRAKPVEKPKYDVPAAAEAEVDRLRWMVWIVAQIDV